MLRQGAPAREFTDAAALTAHYRALRERTWSPRTVPQRPDPTRTLTLPEARKDRVERERAALQEDRARILELAAQVLTPEHLAREPRHIIAGVAAAFGFTHADIVGPRTLMPLVRARWAAITAVHEARPDLSLNRLGRIFNRDHTTIRHALVKVAAEGVPQPPPPGEPA